MELPLRSNGPSENRECSLFGDDVPVVEIRNSRAGRFRPAHGLYCRRGCLRAVSDGTNEISFHWHWCLLANFCRPAQSATRPAVISRHFVIGYLRAWAAPPTGLSLD